MKSILKTSERVIRIEASTEDQRFYILEELPESKVVKRLQEIRSYFDPKNRMLNMKIISRQRPALDSENKLKITTTVLCQQ
jgi:hypothetical protein